MIIDAHLHCTGRETADDVLRTLDDAAVDVGVLLAPFLSDGYSLGDPASLRHANEHLGRIVRGHADRMVGFAVVNPSDPAAPGDLRHAVEAWGLKGVKMVPSGWYPYAPEVQPAFAVAAELELPVLFHSGIFIDGKSGRFCRPVYFEALRDHPGARVALAHLGWPWTDEALAVCLIDRIHGVEPAQAQFRLDISFGPPPPYRREVLSRAVEVIGPQSLQFGSDCFLPCAGEELRRRRCWVEDLMDEMTWDAATREQVFVQTAAAWLRLPGRSERAAVREDPARSAAVSAPAASPAAQNWVHRTGTAPDARCAPAGGASASPRCC